MGATLHQGGLALLIIVYRHLLLAVLTFALLEDSLRYIQHQQYPLIYNSNFNIMLIGEGHIC